MTYISQNQKRPIATSLRIPADLLEGLEQIQREQHTNQTGVIIQAIAYWISVNGKATADGEYLNRLSNLEKANRDTVELLQKQGKELEELRTIIAKQNNTIDTLLEKISK